MNGNTYTGFYEGFKHDPGNQSPAWWTNQGWGYAPVYGSAMNSPDIIAHIDADPSPFTVEVPAGSDVVFEWYHTGTCGEMEIGWDCSHHGWTSTFLAPCNDDCKDVEKTDLQFFKIHESALIDYRTGRYSTGPSEEQVGYWGTDEIFYDNNNTLSVRIPQSIPTGNYVLRTEVASLHNNSGLAGRQFWPQAFNVEVTGGNDSAPMPSGVRGTEIYSPDDELLQWDLYWHTPNKTFSFSPGPSIIS
jgi:hypothetical protein